MLSRKMNRIHWGKLLNGRENRLKISIIKKRNNSSENPFACLSLKLQCLWETSFKQAKTNEHDNQGAALYSVYLKCRRTFKRQECIFIMPPHNSKLRAEQHRFMSLSLYGRQKLTLTFRRNHLNLEPSHGTEMHFVWHLCFIYIYIWLFQAEWQTSDDIY